MNPLPVIPAAFPTPFPTFSRCLWALLEKSRNAWNEPHPGLSRGPLWFSILEGFLNKVEFYFFYTRIPLVFPGFPAWNCHLGSCWKSGIAQDFMDASKHLELRGFIPRTELFFMDSTLFNPHGSASMENPSLCLLFPNFPAAYSSNSKKTE